MVNTIVAIDVKAFVPISFASSINMNRTMKNTSINNNNNNNNNKTKQKRKGGRRKEKKTM